MSLSCGIIGLPNVGKSTLFNCLTSANVQSDNYPFCTIEPNIGIVNVPDKRLEALAKIVKSKQIKPATISFIDIAGLVKGANKGDGLGNKFLNHIRDVNAICHLVRCFENENIIHVNEKTDPIHDIYIVDTELILADYDTVLKNFNRNKKNVVNHLKKDKEVILFYEKILEHLNKSKPARTFKYDKNNNELKNCFYNMHLLSSKPTLFIANVDEDTMLGKSNIHLNAIKKLAKKKGEKVIIICAKIENELSKLNYKDRIDFFKNLNIKDSGLQKIIKASFKLLNLRTYLTAGSTEVKAWTFKKNTTAPQAAGIIHSDFERGFIKADVINYEDFIKYNGEPGCRQAGAIKLEGKDYIVKDGDIIHFKFNV